MFLERMMNYCALLILLTIFCVSSSLYSNTSRRCIVRSVKGVNIGDLKIERVPNIKTYEKIRPKHYYRKKLNFLNNQSFIYHNFIAAGGSGEVYLVQLEKYDPIHQKIVSQPKVTKRYFKDRVQRFQEEFYIMHQLNQSMNWLEYPDYDDNDVKRVSKLSIYPYTTCVSWGKAKLPDFNLPVLLYKVCKDTQKAHRKGIIHNDMKLGNTLIVYPNPSAQQFYDVQLIDWNLAVFYYPGRLDKYKRGTPCYYSPQALFTSNFITQATDVYSLGVAIFNFITGKKPYMLQCSSKNKNNIQSVASLVGIESMVESVYKNRYYLQPSTRKQLHKINKKQQKYKGTLLEKLVPPKLKEYFDQNLLMMLEAMLQMDPEKRITMEEVVNSQYFEQIKRLPPMFQAKNMENQKKSNKNANIIKYQQNKQKDNKIIDNKEVTANKVIDEQKYSIQQRHIEQKQIIENKQIVKQQKVIDDIVNIQQEEDGKQIKEEINKEIKSSESKALNEIVDNVQNDE